MTTPSRDYTELVIELWEACRSRKPKLCLPRLGTGSSEEGVNEIRVAASLFIACHARAFERGHVVPNWSDAAREYATTVSKRWAQGNIPAEVGELESIAYKVIKKYGEK